MQVYHRLQIQEDEEKGRKVEQQIEKGGSRSRRNAQMTMTHGDGMKGLKHFKLEPQCVCG